MVPHCYYVTASAYIGKEAYDAGRRVQRNLRIPSDKKGLELAEELEGTVRKWFCECFSGHSEEALNFSVDSIFDCGEEEVWELTPHV